MRAQAHTSRIVTTPLIRSAANTAKHRCFVPTPQISQNYRFQSSQPRGLQENKGIHPRRHQLEKVSYDLIQTCHIILTCDVQSEGTLDNC